MDCYTSRVCKQNATLTMLPDEEDQETAKQRVSLTVEPCANIFCSRTNAPVSSRDGGTGLHNDTSLKGSIDPNHYLVHFKPQFAMNQMTISHGTLRYRPRGDSCLSLYGRLPSGKYVVIKRSLEPSKASRERLERANAVRSASFVEMDGKMTDSGDPEQRVPIENFSKMSLKVHGCDLIELDPALDTRSGTVTELIMESLETPTVSSPEGTLRGRFQFSYFVKPPLPSTVSSTEPKRFQASTTLTTTGGLPEEGGMPGSRVSSETHTTHGQCSGLNSQGSKSQTEVHHGDLSSEAGRPRKPNPEEGFSPRTKRRRSESGKAEGETTGAPGAGDPPEENDGQTTRVLELIREQEGPCPGQVVQVWKLT